MDAAGFSCVDGFSEMISYAAGGRDVWNFDGDEWSAHFPSNMLIESICCGQDGYVFISVRKAVLYLKVEKINGR